MPALGVPPTSSAPCNVAGRCDGNPGWVEGNADGNYTGGGSCPGGETLCGNIFNGARCCYRPHKNSTAANAFDCDFVCTIPFPGHPGIASWVFTCYTSTA